MKIDLALKQDFNLFDAFRMFDTKNKGAINNQDFVDGLRMNLEYREFTHLDTQMFFKEAD